MVGKRIPSTREVAENIRGNLRMPSPSKGSVPQLQFEPSIGIIARDIDKMGMDIRSFREPLTRAIKKVIIPSIQKNFEVGGRPAWEPYSPATLEIRERMGGDTPNKLLNKTGALQKAMKQFNIWTVNDTAAILLDLPANVSYGKIHQGGYNAGSAALKSVSKGTKSVRDAALQAKLRAALRSGSRVQNFDFGIPARPFVVYQEQDLDAIQREFDNWLQEKINKYWMKGV